MGTRNGHLCLLLILLCFSLSQLVMVSSSLAFQSDELLVDDDEFGLEGGRSPDLALTIPTRSAPPHIPFSQPSNPTRTRSSDTDSDSKVQIPLEHAFGDSDFSPAGTFTARLKTWSHGGQTLTKLRFSREAFPEIEKEKFKKLLEGDDFYRVRVPSNVLSPTGSHYIISSVKARCLPRDRLDEHFVIHMPAKWSFNSHTVLKNSEQAPRTVAFAVEILGGEIGEGEVVKPPERSLWAKYWMYLVPLGLIVMNAITQAMNMPEEQASGQSASQTQQPTAAIRGQGAAVRRR